MLFPFISNHSTLLPRVITQCLCVSHCLTPCHPFIHPLFVTHLLTFNLFLLPASICPSHSPSPAHESSEQIYPWPFSPRCLAVPLQQYRGRRQTVACDVTTLITAGMELGCGDPRTAARKREM